MRRCKVTNLAKLVDYVARRVGNKKGFSGWELAIIRNTSGKQIAELTKEAPRASILEALALSFVNISAQA